MRKKSFFPLRRAYLLPVGALASNMIVYYGSKLIVGDRPRVDLALPIDSAVPVLPWTIVIYLGCFLVWIAVCFYTAAQEHVRTYQFFGADLLAKVVCFFFFVFLPTTNVRPVLEGGLCVWILNLVYRLDAPPANLFPSIHCMAAWLCFINVRNDRRAPLWGKAAACAGALLVCLSTLTTRQHVLVDVPAGILLAEGSWWTAGKALVYHARGKTRLSRSLEKIFGF